MPATPTTQRNQANQPFPLPSSAATPPSALPPARSRTLGDIADAARNRAKQLGSSYAFAAVPTSPYPLLTGNREPNSSGIGWLKNRNKCNQFAGDVLYSSGFVMPTFTMQDGSRHFVNAEALPSRAHYFQRVSGLSAAQPGDLIVFDRYARSGENGAHVEVVTYVDQSKLYLTGARKDGASERDHSYLLNSGYRNPAEQIFVLRPKQRR